MLREPETIDDQQLELAKHTGITASQCNRRWTRPKTQSIVQGTIFTKRYVDLTRFQHPDSSVAHRITSLNGLIGRTIYQF